MHAFGFIAHFCKLLGMLGVSLQDQIRNGIRKRTRISYLAVGVMKFLNDLQAWTDGRKQDGRMTRLMPPVRCGCMLLLTEVTGGRSMPSSRRPTADRIMMMT